MARFTWIMSTLAIMSGIVLATAGVAAAQGQAAPSPLPVAYHELIQGNPKAKVTVVEFASFTCPHCARFQQTVFPEIKKNYIDTGKIRYVYKDYPLDELATSAAMLPRCASGDRGSKLVDLIFKNQAAWASAPKPLVPLRAYAQLAGMSSDDVDACLRNGPLLQAIKDEQNKATTLYQVEATPTFYVGDEKVSGERPYDEFAKILDKQLAKAK